MRSNAWLSKGLCAAILLCLAVAPGIGRAQEGGAGKPSDQAFLQMYANWQHARSSQQKLRLGRQLYDAAIHHGRPDIAEQVVAGGPLEARELKVNVRGRDVPLRVVHAFEEIPVNRQDAFNPAPNQGEKWLARRITRDAFEIWTSQHGWLFNGTGHLVNEARPIRQESSPGREWYGAFLPDGRWVTTDLAPDDSKLSFFSREGEFLKALSCAELAKHGFYAEGVDLLGWARSNKSGTSWIVNVGSEEGYATVQIGPEGAARVLKGTERWRDCYPRALGARGWYISSWDPDDTGKVLLRSDSPGHGMGVGYPSYSRVTPTPTAEQDELENGKWFCSVPGGNYLFGFWPHSRNVFIGSGGYDENATWFFNPKGKLQGWLPARRIADAAHGRSTLFRLEDGTGIVTLRPDLTADALRRFVWADGSSAVALSLFDDLHLGLFIQDGKLVLASWS